MCGAPVHRPSQGRGYGDDPSTSLIRSVRAAYVNHMLCVHSKSHAVKQQKFEPYTISSRRDLRYKRKRRVFEGMGKGAGRCYNHQQQQQDFVDWPFADGVSRPACKRSRHKTPAFSISPSSTGILTDLEIGIGEIWCQAFSPVLLRQLVPTYMWIKSINGSNHAPNLVSKYQGMTQKLCLHKARSDCVIQ